MFIMTLFIKSPKTRNKTIIFKLANGLTNRGTSTKWSLITNNMDESRITLRGIQPGAITLTPPRDIWQFLETVLVVTNRESVLLACS